MRERCQHDVVLMRSAMGGSLVMIPAKRRRVADLLSHLSTIISSGGVTIVLRLEKTKSITTNKYESDGRQK